MSVYIKGMEMPKSCGKCKLFDASHAISLVAPLGWCRVNGKEIFRVSEKADFCPLILAPPHGRLIDADALEDFVIALRRDAIRADELTGRRAEWDTRITGMKRFVLAIEDAPTIIPADKED